ncbi:hypothetical protein GPECTOR_3g246 [Gonium pectorale]|uniref:Uncharacterized protein n=1 Tax=Gonium pectorale TaxID=33097 RepID=A0A150GZ32_GONPE|nr:hypothetical protein GPECTOR_3g246 [Gonium pectorale]|eukprot:KXZ55091.1 hypothetical protein GPECTOR_3g246 [Gonium pectorale]
MIDELNDSIDTERRDVAGRTKFMRDYPEVTNEFLHFFLDGIMEAMEKEQAGVPARRTVSAVGRSGGGGGAGVLSGVGPLRPTSTSSGGTGAGSSSSGTKERFSGVSRRLQS